MPRELIGVPAPAPAPPAYVAGHHYKSLLRFLRMHELEVQVIALWVLWLVLRQLQSILGPWRRRSRHKVVQYGAMAAYYLPTIIAFYTANAVRSSSSDVKAKLSLSIGCAYLLFACARGAVTMTAFIPSRGARRVESWRLLPWLLYLPWLGWDFIWLDHRPTKFVLVSFFVFYLGPVIYVLVAKPRAAVLDYETKQFADYMVSESRSTSSSSSSPFFDDISGEDASSLYEVCKYPFLQLEDGEWINFSDVLKQRGRLPAGSSADGDPADICLSYTFCRLLARHYFGFHCAEVGDAQVRDFVLTNLVAADYKRAFAIVEVQLALLHDYFFTNFHSELASGFVSLKLCIVQMVCLIVFYVADIVVSYRIDDGYKKLGIPLLEYLYAYILPGALVCIVVIQPRTPLLPSYWHPMRNLLLYYQPDASVHTPSIQDLFQLCCQSHPSARRSRSCCHVHRHNWREKLSQYSVMEDYDHRSFKKIIIAWCKVYVLSQVSYSFIKHHPAERDEVSIRDSVKRSVAHAIKDLNGPPTICSKSTLLVVDDLSWTYRQETLTHTIIIWHIATCYCDMLSQSQEPETTENHDVAIDLSRYCAYLVAFLPELLPEHTLTAKFVLQQVLQESKDALTRAINTGGEPLSVPDSQPVLWNQKMHSLLERVLSVLGRTRMSMEDKRTMIQELQLPELDESVLNTFQNGVRLGRLLEQQSDVSARWKAIADFWVEMILYVASSPDSAAAHVEQLAQGGEFVTHIWALLCNAGLVKQATEEWTPPYPPNMAREVKLAIRFHRRTKSA